MHRLSPDLLALIFADLADDHDDHPIHPIFGSCSWKYLAHICHRWREVALSCSVLWTQISTRYPDAALTCIERSTDAPFTFVIDPRATVNNSKEIVERVLPHTHRMRQLYIPWRLFHDDDGNVSELVAPLIDASAPQLEVFHAYHVRDDGKCFALPPIFGGKTPRLTVLKLVYCYPRMDVVSFTNLKELYIKGRKHDAITMEFSTLMSILEACPALEVFVTVKTLFVKNESLNDDQSSRVIRLDNLRRIDIARCSASVVADILSHLNFPNCQLRMSVWLERRADFRFVFGVPAELCEGHPLRDVRKLHVNFWSTNGGITLEGMTGAHPFQISATIPPGSDIGDMPTVSGQLLLSVARTLDLGLLEEFAISETQHDRPHTGFSREVWAQVLGCMPLLRTLHFRLQSIADSGFCRAVLAALATRDAIARRPICPLLEEITLVRDRTWSSLQWWQFAKVRKDQGYGLKHLSLSLPHYENVEDMTETDLAILREVIDEVDLFPPELEDIRISSNVVW